MSLWCYESVKQGALFGERRFERLDADFAEAQFHHDRVLTRPVIMPSQTPFLKSQPAIKVPSREVRSSDLERDELGVLRPGLRDSKVKQMQSDAHPPKVRMHRDVQDVAFVGDQPSAEKTDSVRRAIWRERC